MLDVKEILSNPEHYRQALSKRLDHIDFSDLITWDAQRRSLTHSISQKRQMRRTLSEEVGRKLRERVNADDIKAQATAITSEIEAEEHELEVLEARIKDYMDSLPNVPEEEVPPGGKENNVVLEVVGKQPQFAFQPKDHVELATSLKLVDFAKGVAVGGRNKWVYWGDGATLEWALINYFITQHIKNGYTFVLPPHLLRTEAGYVAGQFPKFGSDVFYVTSEDATGPLEQFLLPTAETALVGLYMDTIIPEDELPIRLFSYTPCYRNESFGSGATERGTVRGNQFNKVEMVHFTRPEDSQAHFEEMIGVSKALMDGLGLHYRVSRLAAQDCSASMAKTYDIEVWIPSMNAYKEVSSVSTAHTYQAIRGKIRYRDSSTKKTRFVHTLNGSALATSRVFPAILEQFQQPDGRVHIPDVLQPMVGKEFLG